MSENQKPIRSSMPATSKRGKLKSKNTKQRKSLDNFSNFLDGGKSNTLPDSHSGAVAPQVNASNSQNIENAVASTNQQHESSENELGSDFGHTQEMAELDMEQIVEAHKTTSRMSSITDDNSVSLPAARAQTNTNNNVTTPWNNPARSRTQLSLSRTGSLESTKSKSPTLTAEQRARIERNKRQAELKRQQRQSGQHDATRQLFTKECRTISDATNPSQESTSSANNYNAHLASKPSHDAHLPMSNGNSKEAESTLLTREDSCDSNVPQMEGLEFSWDEEDQKESKSNKKRKSAEVTLTQGFGYTVEKNGPKKKKSANAPTFPVDEFYFERHRCLSDVLFKKKDVWYSDRPEFVDGWAFLIDHIDLVNGIHVAKAHAFMKVEKTFIGEHEAAKLTHTRWVLVKKHINLPKNGHINLKDLSKRMPARTPQDYPFHLRWENRHLALRYEEDGDIIAFYAKLGEQLSSTSDNQRQPRFLDCFAGGGGMSVGIRETGFFSEKSYKMDWNETACDTLRKNFPKSKVFHLDIRDLHHAAIIPRLIDYQTLSPPCQGFSRVNTSGGANDIQNNNCTLSCIESVRRNQPSHLTMENVPGILDEKQVSVAERSKKSYLQEFICGLLSMGYQVRLCKRLNAKHYGDPQDRERVILFGCAEGYTLPSAPLPTHGNEAHLERYVTVRDVLSDLESIEPTEDGIVRLKNGKIAHGHYFNPIKEKGEHEELQPDMPAQTIRKKNQLMHYNRKRNATILERARLMSFPDEHIFQGSQSDQLSQIGNAVPVRFATAIANEVKKSLTLGLHEEPEPYQTH